MFWLLTIVVLVVVWLLKSSAADEAARGRLQDEIAAEFATCIVDGMPDPSNAHGWKFGENLEASAWKGRSIWGLPHADLLQCQEELRALHKNWLGELRQQLSAIPTSTTDRLLGRRIAKQVRMIRVDACDTDDSADFELRKAAYKVGARGIINMRVRPYPGGKFSAEGDAVTLQDD